MEKHVITKIVEHCGEVCPSFKYNNPLLDENVTRLLAKGFIELLNNQDSNSAAFKKHRQLVLENIRKSCQVQPSNHLYIDDNVSEILQNTYKKLPDESDINKELDTFLIRNLKETYINSIHSPSFTPDIVQALINLNGDKEDMNDIFLKDIIFWNVDTNGNGYMDILKAMWDSYYVESAKLIRVNTPLFDEISIKMKPLIENIVISSAMEMLDIAIGDEDDWLYNNDKLKKLIEMCSASSESFQISCAIMNTLFLKTNFSEEMYKFIILFIDQIKEQGGYIFQKYPTNLQHIVVLLDINLTDLKGEIQIRYIENTLDHLNRLYIESKSDLIMLLTHFNQWFNLYYDSKIQ